MCMQRIDKDVSKYTINSLDGNTNVSIWPNLFHKHLHHLYAGGLDDDGARKVRGNRDVQLNRLLSQVISARVDGQIKACFTVTDIFLSRDTQTFDKAGGWTVRSMRCLDVLLGITGKNFISLSK